MPPLPTEAAPSAALPATRTGGVRLATPIAAGAGPRRPEREDRSDWLAKLRTGLRKTGSSIAAGLRRRRDRRRDVRGPGGGAAPGRCRRRRRPDHLLDDLQRRVKRAHVRRIRRPCAACSPTASPTCWRRSSGRSSIGEHAPTVIMVVGVNGAGKTTSVGKLTRHLVDADQKVLLAAADTFRAAAREQLLAWAERAELAPRSRPADRRQPRRDRQPGRRRSGRRDLRRGRRRPARGCDVVIADTAGRLATQSHLMEELKKIRRTIGKAAGRARRTRCCWSIDGNTGQNALAQVQAFDAALRPDRPRSSPSSTAPPRAACWRRSRSGRARAARPCRCTSSASARSSPTCRPFARASSRSALLG